MGIESVDNSGSSQDLEQSFADSNFDNEEQPNEDANEYEDEGYDDGEGDIEETDEVAESQTKLLAGKFKSQEELITSYKQLEKALTKANQERSANQQRQQQPVNEEKQLTNDELLAKLVEDPAGFIKEITKQQNQHQNGYVQSIESATDDAISMLESEYQVDEDFKDQIFETIQSNDTLSRMLDDVITADNYNQFGTDVVNKHFRDVMDMAYWIAKGKAADNQIASTKANVNRDAKRNQLQKQRLQTQKPGTSSSGKRSDKGLSSTEQKYLEMFSSVR